MRVRIVCGRCCCCRRSTRSARSASSWSSLITTCFTVGSSGSRRRSGMGPDDIHEESRPASGGRSGAHVSRRTHGSRAASRAAVGRALLERRHPDCGAGVDEELQGEGGSSEPPALGRNGERVFHGEKRSNANHVSSTDPEAQLYKKGPGKEAKLRFIGHALMENRSGLIVAASVTKATGPAERKAAEEMIVRRSPGVRRITVGGDNGYDAASFIADTRAQRDAAHRPEHQRLALCARRAHHAPSRLRSEPADEEAHRGAVRLGQDQRRTCVIHAARHHEPRLHVQTDDG
jgi:hypothetical protein